MSVYTGDISTSASNNGSSGGTNKKVKKQNESIHMPNPTWKYVKRYFNSVHVIRERRALFPSTLTMSLENDGESNDDGRVT